MEENASWGSNSKFPNIKAQRLQEGTSAATGAMSSTFGKVITQAETKGEAPPPPTTLWSDTDFVTFQFKSSHLPFSKEFYRDYQTLKSKLNYMIVSMKNNLLLRLFMMEDREREKERWR